MTLLTLPEEILCNILSGLTSSELIQASTTCRRFKYSAQQILFLRLRDISKLEGHKFIFGCATSAHRHITPYQTCLIRKSTSPVTATTSITSHYTSFLPLAPSNARSSYTNLDATPRPMSTTVSLDPSVTFVQLITNAQLLKLVPEGEGGLYSSLLPVASERLFRLRRKELKSAARSKQGKQVWLDEQRNCGIRIKVTEKEKQPWVASAEESEDERPESWLVEYEEVIVRTGALLLTLEEKREGAENAVVIGKG
ncbi:hypothetical protein FPQ18DRAFT_64711 [Pyronema domesticum]|nr:hypothetical protein FPQ18DRAFT_64711 [Pyronema domesticum]